ncbi:hypothetical protein PVK06_025997 [Gossypium arboreum]|uniref:Uncharacterized protein n=1 Tax=Gossypium arboreum TaxID=29729 RepID=A0ABR0NWF5_GOSAR|nr:hypothetical protein PVK06_025997 [Gossypium arboreum]
MDAKEELSKDGEVETGNGEMGTQKEERETSSGHKQRMCLAYEEKKEINWFSKDLGACVSSHRGKRVLGAIVNHNINVPKSKEFTGTRSANNMDNFLWGIEQYLHPKSIIDDAIKVNIAAMYFSDVTLLWWHHKSTSEKRGGTTIRTLEEFQKEFRA